MSQALKGYFERFRQYHYLGYLRHYYNAARHPHPIRFIVFFILGAILVFSLAIVSTFAILNNTFQGDPIIFYSLTSLLYLIGFAGVPTIVLWIQGYRHRDTITVSDIPDNLPKSSGKEIWYIIILLSLAHAIQKILGW